jgi:F-type H+-transporting ATPase subunit delta
MGSATREAIAAVRATLSAQGASASLATGEQLLSAGRVIGDSSALLSLLADPSADAAVKTGVVAEIFAAKVDAEALAILTTVATSRWSNHSDVLEAIEELGFRVLADSAPREVSIESELASFGEAVSTSDELELALGSKLGETGSKLTLVDALLEGKASAQTLAIVRQLVAQPRGRRIGQLLSVAADIVADQAGKSIATVTSATPIAPAQLARLEKGLSSLYGRQLSVNQQIDAGIIGGLRIQVGDDVIDGSIVARINDLRLQLAG